MIAWKWLWYCDKMAEWIWMPLGMVVGVEPGIGMLNFGGNRRRKGAVLERKNLGFSIVNNGIVSVRGGDAALPKLLWDFLVI